MLHRGMLFGTLFRAYEYAAERDVIWDHYLEHMSMLQRGDVIDGSSTCP